MKARFILKQQAKGKGANSIIYLAVTLHGKRVKVSTGIAIDPKKWNNGYPLKSQTLVIEQLRDLESAVNQHLRDEVVTPLTIKAVVEVWKGKEQPTTTDVKYLIEQFLKERKDKVSPYTHYKLTFQLNEFASYKPNKKVVDLNKKLFADYVDYLVNKGFQPSNTNTYIKNLIVFLNWGYRNDFMPDLSKYVKRVEQPTKEIIAINEDELLQLQQRTNSKGKRVELTERLDRICDLFLFACYSGLRYSDLSRVSKDMINDEVLTIRQQKTGNVVQIPLLYEAQQLLIKYNYQLPEISNQKGNKALKDLFKALGIDRKVMTSTTEKGNLIDQHKPLHEVISFHIGRKSFITLALSRGMHAKVVQAISGHRKDSVFNQYINFSTNTLKEEMNKLSRSARSLKVVKGA